MKRLNTHPYKMVLTFVLTSLHLLLLGAFSTNATPLIALKEADNCGGCHTPGRSQRPVLERRCTLDCQGCHVDPTGAGPRNQWGYYYSQDQMNMGHYFKPQDPLDDTSRYDLHFDSRVLSRTSNQETRSFPMGAEFSVRIRPLIKYLHLTYQANLLGRIGDDSFRTLRSDHRRFQEKYSIMVDGLPLNTYVRAYQGTPMYGVKRVNHGLWIRERLGLDQFALTRALELGLTPNVPFGRGSLIFGDPYRRSEDRQRGWSVHSGLRGVTLGWHVNGSLWRTKSTSAAIKMGALGFGLTPWKLVTYWERNWRSVAAIKTLDATNLGDPQSQNFKSHALTNQNSARPIENNQPSSSSIRTLRVHPSSMIDELTLAVDLAPGTMAGYIHERLSSETLSSRRHNIFIDVHPLPFLQFELWRRFEQGSRKLADTLAISHFYFDF